MTSSRLALVTAVALLSSHLLGAQTPPSAGLIRDVAGSQFVLVARADGSVIGWGHDPDGPGAKPAPVVIDLPGKALRVAVGESSAYALLEDGTVVAWGANDEGQLGNGARGANGVLGVYPKPSVTPVRVTDLADIIEIEAGSKHVLALRKDGTVWAWGRRDDGTVWMWGSNGTAAMGNGQKSGSPDEPGGSNPLPIQVKGIVGAKHLSIGSGHVAAVYLGNLRSYVVRADGTLWISGSAHYPARGILAKNLHAPTRLDLPGPAIAGQPKPASLPAVNSVLGGSYPVDRLEGTLQFTLDSVAVGSRFATAQKNLVAGPGKRLLILTGSLTNIQTYDYPVGGDMVAFNVFSETGERTLNSGGNSFVLPGLMPLKQLAALRATGGRTAWYDIQKDLGRMQSVLSDGLDLDARADAKIGSTFDRWLMWMADRSAGRAT